MPQLSTSLDARAAAADAAQPGLLMRQIGSGSMCRYFSLFAHPMPDPWRRGGICDQVYAYAQLPTPSFQGLPEPGES